MAYKFSRCYLRSYLSLTGTGPWWTNQPKWEFEKTVLPLFIVDSVWHGNAKKPKRKKNGGSRSSKRVTLHFSRKTKKVNSSVIWPRIKKCHKMKHTFHPHFCSKFQSPRPFWPKIAELTKSGQKSRHATRSVIWPRIKKFHKMKYTFHPHFYSKFQSFRRFWLKLTDLVSCWLFFYLIWLFRLFLV